MRKLNYTIFIFLFLGFVSCKKSSSVKPPVKVVEKKDKKEGSLFKNNEKNDEGTMPVKDEVPVVIPSNNSDDKSSFNMKVPDFNENTESRIELQYLGDIKADSCSITDLSHVLVSTPCQCTDGFCSVGVTGVKNYLGEASFRYNLVMADASRISSAAFFNILASSTPLDPIALPSSVEPVSSPIMNNPVANKPEQDETIQLSLKLKNSWGLGQPIIAAVKFETLDPVTDIEFKYYEKTLLGPTDVSIPVSLNFKWHDKSCFMEIVELSSKHLFGEVYRKDVLCR